MDVVEYQIFYLKLEWFNCQFPVSISNLGNKSSASIRMREYININVNMWHDFCSSGCFKIFYFQIQF